MLFFFWNYLVQYGTCLSSLIANRKSVNTSVQAWIEGAETLLISYSNVWNHFRSTTSRPDRFLSVFIYRYAFQILTPLEGYRSQSFIEAECPLHPMITLCIIPIGTSRTAENIDGDLLRSRTTPHLRHPATSQSTSRTCAVQLIFGDETSITMILERILLYARILAIVTVNKAQGIYYTLASFFESSSLSLGRPKPRALALFRKTSRLYASSDMYRLYVLPKFYAYIHPQLGQVQRQSVESSCDCNISSWTRVGRGFSSLVVS